MEEDEDIPTREGTVCSRKLARVCVKECPSERCFAYDPLRLPIAISPFRYNGHVNTRPNSSYLSPNDVR